MFSALGILIYLIVVALAAFALFWVIRLGVRYGLRDHATWVQTITRPAPE